MKEDSIIPEGESSTLRGAQDLTSAPGSGLAEKSSKLNSRYWAVKPQSGYISDVLDARTTLSRVLLPPPLLRWYTRIRRSLFYVIVCCGMGMLVTAFGFLYLIEVRTESNDDVTVRVMGYLIAVSSVVYGLTLIPEIHFDLWKALFRQFEIVFYLIQVLPAIGVCAFHFSSTGEFSRAFATVVGLSIIAMVPIIVDTLPLGGLSKVMVRFTMIGIALGAAFLSR